MTSSRAHIEVQAPVKKAYQPFSYSLSGGAISWLFENPFQSLTIEVLAHGKA